MDYFSIDYQGIENVIQQEEKIRSILDKQSDALFSVMTDVTLQPSLALKGYPKKIWNAYSSVTNIYSKLYFFKQCLMKVNDMYLECEGKVLNNAETIVTAKNGFTGKSVKAVKNANKNYAKYENENHQVKETFWNTVYDSTIASWAASMTAVDKMILAAKDIRANGGKSLLHNITNWLDEKGVPKQLTGAFNMFVREVDSKIKNFEDIIHGITSIANPDGGDPVAAFRQGAKSYLSLVTGNPEIVNATFDIISPDSYLMIRQKELEGRMTEALQEGNYLETGVLLAGAAVETLGKGSIDVGCQWLNAQIDSKMGDISTLVFGEEITLSNINESIQVSTGINPGTVFNDAASAIGDGVSSAIDTFANWLS